MPRITSASTSRPMVSARNTRACAAFVLTSLSSKRLLYPDVVDPDDALIPRCKLSPSMSEGSLQSRRAAVPARYRFGLYEADRRSGELLRDGAKIKLQEQPFQVLLALLERSNEIVTREDLVLRLGPSA